MPDYQTCKVGTSQERINIARRNLRGNPHIAAAHSERRFRALLENVLKPKFNIIDFWYQYEWQGRGSTHVHMFLWIEALPEFNMEVEADRQLFVTLFGSHIAARNPTPERPGAPHPIGAIRTSSDELSNDQSTLSDIINRIQHHECGPIYCKRKKKGASDGPRECRFFLSSHELSTMSQE